MGKRGVALAKVPEIATPAYRPLSFLVALLGFAPSLLYPALFTLKVLFPNCFGCLMGCLHLALSENAKGHNLAPPYAD